MVSGAARARAAVVGVVAAEGVREQSRRHAYLLHLLGIRQVAVVVNKMDLVGFERARFDEVSKEITAYLASIGATPMVIVPISARDGDNIAKRSSRPPWYDGPTVLSAPDGLHGHPGLGAQSLRMPLQDLFPYDIRRIPGGRLATSNPDGHGARKAK